MIALLCYIIIFFITLLIIFYETITKFHFDSKDQKKKTKVALCNHCLKLTSNQGFKRSLLINSSKNGQIAIQQGPKYSETLARLERTF